MKPHAFLSLLTSTFFLCPPVPLQGGVLVSDVFTDANSTNHDIDNNSLQVFYGRSTSNTRIDAAGSVTFGVLSTSSEAYWAHFTEDADAATAGGHSPVSLDHDGATLTVRVDFNLTITATGNTDIRFGIGDSRGTRNTTDLTGGQNNAAFADDSFYGGIFGVTGTGSPFRISKRIAAPASPNNPFNTGADALTLTTESAGSTTRQPLISGEDYTLTYTIRRESASKMVMKVALSGAGITGPYDWTAADDGFQPTALGVNTTFDWVTLRIGGSGFASSVVFKKIEAETNFSGGGTYENWVSGFGLDPAGNGARTEDPDSDGLPNAVENLLGLAPNAADVPPAGVISASLNGGMLEVRFTRSADSVVPWKVEWSTDLAAPWTHAVNDQDGVIITVNPVAGNKEEILVSLPQNSATRLFARVNAS